MTAGQQLLLFAAADMLYICFTDADMLYLSQVTRDSLNPRNKKNIKKRGGNPLVREVEEDLSGACPKYADVC